MQHQITHLHPSTTLREAPLKFTQGAFGHCPFSFCIPPPRTQTGTLGHFLPGRFERLCQITALRVYKCVEWMCNCQGKGFKKQNQEKVWSAYKSPLDECPQDNFQGGQVPPGQLPGRTSSPRTSASPDKFPKLSTSIKKRSGTCPHGNCRPDDYLVRDTAPRTQFSSWHMSYWHLSYCHSSYWHLSSWHLSSWRISRMDLCTLSLRSQHLSSTALLHMASSS